MTPAQQFFNGWLPDWGLAPREQEVLKLLMRGYSERDIAAKLQISRNTVRVYTVRIRERMESCSVRELMFDAWIQFAQDLVTRGGATNCSIVRPAAP